MKPSRVLIKLGGASLQDENICGEITSALKQYLRYGYQVTMVHGGGPAINAELTRRGIAWSFVHGQRVTTPEMMDVIEMVLSGSINKKLVRYMNSNGLPAVGFSGVDRQTLQCHASSEELGLVGTIDHVEASWLDSFVKPGQNTIPVISPIGCGKDGESYNINADWAASSLAIKLDVSYLVFLTDQEGILGADQRLATHVTAADLRDLLVRGIVTGGMATKARAILHALDNGVENVRVMNAKSTVHGLWSNNVGTWCTRESLGAEEIADSFEEPLQHACV